MRLGPPGRERPAVSHDGVVYDLAPLTRDVDGDFLVFFKHPNTVVGPDDPIHLLPEGDRTDWEVELAVVIGRRTRRPESPAEAARHIAGYTVANDVSERTLHQRDDLLRQARRDWADKPGLREKYRKFRPNVERVISQIASRGGRRLKLRYRGTVKNNAWLTQGRSSP